MSQGEFPAVGRIIGARPGAKASCEVELLFLHRTGGVRYRLRSFVVDLERIGRLVGHQFDDPPPDTSTAEDLTFGTLEEALRCASTIIDASRAEPIPQQTRWRNYFQFQGSLSRSKLRSQIDWLSQPPRWWDTTRRVLIRVWWLLLLGTFAMPFIWDKVSGDGEDGGWVLYLVIPGILLALLFLVALCAEQIDNRIERRLIRPRERP